jgi:hypothetical protein
MSANEGIEACFEQFGKCLSPCRNSPDCIFYCFGGAWFCLHDFFNKRYGGTRVIEQDFKDAEPGSDEFALLQLARMAEIWRRETKDIDWDKLGPREVSRWEQPRTETSS